MTIIRMAVLAFFTSIALCGSTQADLVIDDFGSIFVDGMGDPVGSGSTGSGAAVTTSTAGVTASGMNYLVEETPLFAGGPAFIQYLYGTSLATEAGDPFVNILSTPFAEVPDSTGTLDPAEPMTVSIFSLDATGAKLPAGPLFTDLVRDVSGPIDLNAGGGDVATAFGLRFEFTGFTGGNRVLFGSSFGSLVATPEPTAFLMFGSLLGLGLARRRRS